MNAPIAKDELALMMPTTLSHYFKDEPAHMPQPEDSRPGLLARIGGALRWVVSLQHRRAVVDELSALSDHELADIGLSRSELPRVFDPAFAAQRNSERSASVSRGNRAIIA